MRVFVGLAVLCLCTWSADAGQLENESERPSLSGDVCVEAVAGAALVQKAKLSQNDECACPEGHVVLCPEGQARGNNGGRFFPSFFTGLGCSCNGTTGVERGLPYRDPAAHVAPVGPARLVCASVCGNGGNWAATLSFVSEALLTYLDEANDDHALVDLNCFAGGSSGSAVTVLVMNLLSNPSFVTQPGKPITHAQARRLARAIGILASDVDLRNGEGATTVFKIFLEKFADWGEGAWNKCATPLKVSDIMSLGWARGIVLARHMTSDFVDLKVEDSIKDRHGKLSRENVLAVTTAANYLTVSDVPKLDRTGGMAGLDRVTHRQVQSAVNDVREHIQSYSNSFLDFLNVGSFTHQRNGVLVENITVAKYYKWTQAGVDALKQAHVYSEFGSPIAGDFVRQNVVTNVLGHIDSLLNFHFWKYEEEGPKYIDMLSDLDLVLEEPPVDGIMTMVWVQKRSDTDVGVVGVSYPQTQIMAMMSRSTAEAILASQTYRQAINECRQGNRTIFLCRYIIAVANKQRPMLAFATQEPGAQIPYVAHLKDTDIVAAFDPLASELGFALQSTRVEGGLNPRIVILGGFVDGGQYSTLQECYAEGVASRPSWLLFGKVIEVAFSRDIVQGLLSPDPEEADANWDDYMTWKNNTPANVFIDGRADWDCGAKLPANLAGNSMRLRLHGAGLARVDRKDALNDTTPFRPFVFDDMSHCEAEAIAKEAEEHSQTASITI